MDLEKLKAELIRDEGLRLKPYLDTRGIETIGIGHNLVAKGISENVANIIYLEDVEEVMGQLDRALPWWQHLDPVRQRVLANMCFNLGIEKLLGFPHTLILMESGNYEAAAAAMADSLWHRQVGDRAVRLEAMMETGMEP